MALRDGDRPVTYWTLVKNFIAALVPFGLPEPLWIGLAAFTAGAVIWGPWMSLSMSVFQDASQPGALAQVLAARSSLLIMAAWELWAPRRAQQLGRARRWPSNLGVAALDAILVRLVLPTSAVAFALFVESQGWGLLNAWPLPAWVAKAKREPDFRWTISIGGGFKTTWLINGRTFNPARAEHFPKLGTTETWEIVNRTGVAHVMHLHHTDWYLLSRNGEAPPPW